jgi:DNA polymerase V
LGAIQPATSFEQINLFEENPAGLFSEKRELMATIDLINTRFKKGISIAVTNIDRSWQPKAERKSLHYTTNWDELVCVHCH